MAALNRGLELLEIAIGYALNSAALAGPQLLSYPTPCAGWDLETLLDHLSDSLAAIEQALTTARVDINRAGGERADSAVTDPVARLRGRASAVLGACANADPACAAVEIGGRTLPGGLVAVAGAVELSAHGWDIAAACGADQSVPPILTGILLPIAPLLIRPDQRPGLFAEPVRLAGSPGLSDQYVAFLGRDPGFARILR